MRPTLLVSVLLFSSSLMAQAQQPGKPEDTEVWEPVPKTVTATPHFTPPPSDALVLFDGKDLTPVGIGRRPQRAR